jgi:hypothetical protein
MFAHNLYMNPAQSFKRENKRYQRKQDQGLRGLIGSYNLTWQQHIECFIRQGLILYPKDLDYAYSRAYWTHTKEVQEEIDFWDPCTQVKYIFCN